MSRRILAISTDLFLEWLQLRKWPDADCVTPLPSDAKIIDARFNGFGDRVELLLESERFESIVSGDAIPFIDLQFAERSPEREIVDRVAAAGFRETEKAFK